MEERSVSTKRRTVLDMTVMVMIIIVIKIVILIVIVTVIATTEMNSVSRTLCHPERVQVNK